MYKNGVKKWRFLNNVSMSEQLSFWNSRSTKAIPEGSDVKQFYRSCVCVEK